MFSNARKQAQQTAHRLISGHLGLIAWWTLRHAGVLDAMIKHEEKKTEDKKEDPFIARDYALRTNMSADVLEALLDYLAAAGLIVRKDAAAQLTSDGKALLQHEDGVLHLIKAYEPVVEMTEHLLAKLKNYSPGGNGAGSSGGGSGGGGGGGGVQRKSEYLIESQAQRHAADIYPATAELVKKYKLSHLLDITCGTGELLIHLAKKWNKLVGVGIGNDGFAVRRANAAITAADLEKRLIAIAANPLDVLTETQHTFDRIGVSRQLWGEINGMVALQLFSELAARENQDSPAQQPAPTGISRTLASMAKNFSKARLLIIEPVASPRLDRNYYAAELVLLRRLTRSNPWPAEKWRDLFRNANLTLLDEIPLVTDGLTIFVCEPKQNHSFQSEPRP